MFIFSNLSEELGEGENGNAVIVRSKICLNSESPTVARMCWANGCEACFSICQKRTRVTSQETELKEIGTILQSCVLQNSGKPPAAVAYDNHGSFALVNKALLGLMDAESLNEIPFWESCVSHNLGLPLFVCKVCKFEDTYPIFGVNDPLHVQKVACKQAAQGERNMFLRIIFYYLL